MTTEEINRAGWEYANESIDETTEIPKNIELIKASAVVDFIEGAKFVNKHWQEKTKWIPVEERLPVFEVKRRTILVKTGDDLYSFLWIIQEVSLSDFECQGYTHWKEIE